MENNELEINKISKVSLITVCLNSAKTLTDTIESIVAQSYQNLEYIIIDGGSTDGTLEIIRRHEKHIAVWLSEPDNGIYDAMNKGIRMATGEIVGIVNSDDFLEDNALDVISTSYIKNKQAEVIYGKARVIDDKAKISFIVRPPLDLSGKKIYGMNIPHGGVYITKKCYEKHGLYNIKYSLAADHELMVRLATRDINFMYIDEILINQRLGGASSANFLKTINEYRIININNGQSYYKAWMQYFLTIIKTFIFFLLTVNPAVANKYENYKNKKEGLIIVHDEGHAKDSFH